MAVFSIINNDKLSALISLSVAIIILAASYFQWWHITMDGGMPMRGWIKVLFVFLILALLTSGALILW